MDENQSILYHNDYSICALMVRYTLALRGPPKDERSALDIPVLDVRNGTPVQDSLEITHFIAERYPNLIPESHQEEITTLLKELHEVNYFSLSFAKFGGAHVAAGLAAAVEKIVQDPSISDRYRSALEFKREVVKNNKVIGMEPEIIKEMERRAKVISDRLADTLPESSDGAGDGPWMFGLQEPTALDAHTIVFVERMRDINRTDLVPEKLNPWSQKATEQDAWRNLMDGRRTMAPPCKP